MRRSRLHPPTVTCRNQPRSRTAQPRSGTHTAPSPGPCHEPHPWTDAIRRVGPPVPDPPSSAPYNQTRRSLCRRSKLTQSLHQARSGLHFTLPSPVHSAAAKIEPAQPHHRSSAFISLLLKSLVPHTHTIPPSKSNPMSHSTHSLSLRWFSTIALFLLLVSTSHATIPGQTQKRPRSLANQFLIPQNAARSVLRLRPLVWDAKLARYAQWYANQRRNDCALEHSNGPYGENIFWGSGTGWKPAQAVSAWVEERQWYNYWHNSCANGQMCGHYTQIVWSTTRKVGCATVTCTAGKGVFMTCNYDPPGNYYGERPY